VRLRAIVSLGKLSNPRTVPVLLRGLTDSNRMVRLRAGEGLAQLRASIGLAAFNQTGGTSAAVDDLEKIGLLSVFRQVVALKDRYGLHAYLTALENANVRGKLEEEIQRSADLSPEQRRVLQEVLQTGQPVEQGANEPAPVKAALLP
jgi:HEAT repeat protein